MTKTNTKNALSFEAILLASTLILWTIGFALSLVF